VAKLTGPCFSLKASGQLGKTLVFFPWKGLNALRTYVIPANPKSAAQTTQRGYFEDAVDEWHGAAYSAADVSAWNRLAGIADKIMTGFNRMIREYVKEAITANVWERIHYGSTSDVLTVSFVAICHKAAAGNAPSVHYGISKTNMPNTVELDSAGGDTWQNLIEGLTIDTLYYFYFDVGTTATDYGRTGIYSQRTAAA